MATLPRLANPSNPYLKWTNPDEVESTYESTLSRQVRRQEERKAEKVNKPVLIKDSNGFLVNDQSNTPQTSQVESVAEVQKFGINPITHLPYPKLGSKIAKAVDDVILDPPSKTSSDISLPYGLALRDYQQPIWDYMMQDIPGLRALTIWPRRNGKDLTALNILLAKAVQRPGLYMYIGPLHTQTRQIVWTGQTNGGRPFLDYIPPQLVKKKRESLMEIELINGSIIKVVGSDRYDSLMGLNAVGVVFTEYSLQRVEAWDYIRPMMAENGGWALFNGTPRGLNHMHAMAKMAEKNEKWFYQYLTRDDTGRPSLEAIDDDRRGGMKESKIEQEYYCSWTSSTESVFIPLDLVDPCLKPSAELSPDLYSFQPRVFGVDVAYAPKGDKASIAFRQGRKVHWVRWYQGRDNMAFAKEIAKFIKAFKPHAVFIDAGRGEGVISRLHQLGYDHIVHAVHFNGKVYEEGIANMKALMWTRMLTWFLDSNKPDMYNLDNNQHANEPVEEDLAKELSTPFMIEDEKNMIRVEPKTSLKARGESSPDLAEALGLTFAEEIEPEDVVDPKLEEMGITNDMLEQLNNSYNEQAYDPLNHANSLTGGSDAIH